MRAAVFAERVSPLLDEMDEVLAVNPSDVAPKDRPKLNRARMDAAKHRKTLRDLLHLDDED